jgi:hypothetical protein
MSSSNDADAVVPERTEDIIRKNKRKNDYLLDDDSINQNLIT